jgi:hypothetical protein
VPVIGSFTVQVLDALAEMTGYEAGLNDKSSPCGSRHEPVAVENAHPGRVLLAVPGPSLLASARVHEDRELAMPCPACSPGTDGAGQASVPQLLDEAAGGEPAKLC